MLIREVDLRPLEANMFTKAWLESKSRPIALADVISALLDARTIPLETSAGFDLPGPDTLTVREMLMLVAELQGRRIPAVRVPLLSPGLSALWLRLVTGEQYHLARELVLGLRDDLLPKDERYWELVGHRPRWSFHDAAEDAPIPTKCRSKPLQTKAKRHNQPDRSQVRR